MDMKFKEFTEYLLKEETWIDLGFVTLKIIFVLLLTAVVVKFGKRIIERLFLVRQRSPLSYDERRQNTLLKLLQNILTYAVYFASILAILSTFGINVAGLVAGAGIVGLAVGFGAQSLVKDVITGFFIVFEDQFAVGDQVQIGQSMGVVIEIGLRTTKVKSYTGELHIIPNGNISEVINYSIYNSIALIDISVSYESDIQVVENIIKEFLQDLPNKYEELVSIPDLLGVQSLAASEVILRVVAETLPSQQHGVARNIRRDLKEYLEQKGIEIPYPKMVVYQSKE
ncbi:small conductance mechanosensitive channel [Psychrobacillus insolitus]|jgi:small conductance mechanosensitive channel|uniref:Small conductance mechanosensitive channel n=1 Tax=Psychrobacillus insolitus TaxID=1461 RepID=A0A2W7MN85_9BACI|nr:mechanosensitive ion channel family protein [Psychrobacillus insolitus]PZX03733.1 small conductance mechanosensitive channel [Psychrobacillus insolitus]